MADSVFVKGFRTQMAYFVESTYGTSGITNVNTVRRVSGKVKSISWTARQNIIKTGNVGDGRNYKQQLLGNYDASASITWEVNDFSFLRFAVGDIATFASGTSANAPFFLVEAELTGTDAATGLSTAASDGFAKIRIRPFTIMAYDIEGAGTTYNDNVDEMYGCMINDFNLSAAIGAPLMCSTNIVVREIAHRRAMSITPNFASAVTTTDNGNGETTLTPAISQTRADEAPLMFYGGTVSYGGNALAQVTSFNNSYSNQFIVYRKLGSRFIEMPQTGMRNQTLSMNMIFAMPGDMLNGVPSGSATSILEVVKQYLGYSSSFDYTTTTLIRPALSTSVSTSSPQLATPVETTQATLTFGQADTGSGKIAGAKIDVHNLTPEGFGTPIVLENGLIEIPVSFSVRGYPYNRIGDGSYGGHDGAGSAITDIHPTYVWWRQA